MEPSIGPSGGTRINGETDDQKLHAKLQASYQTFVDVLQCHLMPTKIKVQALKQIR